MAKNNLDLFNIKDCETVGGERFFGAYLKNENELVLDADTKSNLVECIKNEDNLVNAIIKKSRDEDSNNGLLFHMCGFDGKQQQEEEKRIFDTYGIYIF